MTFCLSNSLSLCFQLVNREMFWVVTEICREPNVVKRMKLIKHFIKIASMFLVFFIWSLHLHVTYVHSLLFLPILMKRHISSIIKYHKMKTQHKKTTTTTCELSVLDWHALWTLPRQNSFWWSSAHKVILTLLSLWCLFFSANFCEWEKKEWFWWSLSLS